MMENKLTIVMVSYNSEKTIARALDSIFKQTRQPDEVLVIDGDSTDKTIRIIESYDCSYLRYTSEKDDGIYNAMNKGIKRAQGNILGFLNSDDELSDSQCLERIMSVFDRNEKIKIFMSGVDYVKSNGTISRKWRLNDIQPFKSGWHPPHPGFYAQRDLLRSVKGFEEKYRIASDFDIMLRCILRVERDSLFVDKGKVVNMYLGGASNASIKNILQGNKEIRHSLRSNGFAISILYTVKRLTQKFLSQC